MHHSRLCAVLIDCKTSDVDEAARFWGEALGRPVDPSHPGSRGNYRMLETPPDEPIVQIQRVDHESRLPIDIETDDIPAEVTRLALLAPDIVDMTLAAGMDHALIVERSGRATPADWEEQRARLSVNVVSP